MVGCLVCLCVCVVGSRVRNIGVCSFSKEDVLPRKASFTYVAYYTHPISVSHYPGLSKPN